MRNRAGEAIGRLHEGAAYRTDL